MLTKDSKYYLKISKAKAKLKEFDTYKDDYPRFPVSSDYLSYSAVYVISRYCELYLEENEEQKRYYDDLTLASEYFDSEFKAKNRQLHDWDFKMSAIASYFLSDNFGNAKAVLLDIKFEEIDNRIAQYVYYLCSYIFCDSVFNNTDPWITAIIKYLDKYFYKGDDKEHIFEEVTRFKECIDKNGGPLDLFYIDIFCSLIKKIFIHTARELLPLYSNIDKNVWNTFLAKPASPKILWPAQQLVGEYGVFAGKNAIIQLPTGVGKTKSIELIIRSAILAERADNILIIAPLRALCSEITIDLSKQFNESDIKINRISDALQFDFLFDLDTSRKNIIVCTPEKISFLMRHELNVLALIDLFIFDEAHMFDDSSRGVNYEMLLQFIKMYSKQDSQKVLISAVLPNADDINAWLFNNEGVIVKSGGIKVTSKSNGVISNGTDITFLEDDFSSEEYYVPRVIRRTKLKPMPRERTQKYFPDNNSLDYALYLALKFIAKSSTAIYIGRIQTVKTIINRANDLIKREYLEIDKLNQYNDKETSYKLSNLINAHYGTNSIHSLGSCLGIYSHYNVLENGIKISIEDGLKQDKIKLVVCTSTLAQGVNVPIKYLLISSTRVNSEMMMVRNFQNLIGRTARSGMHTEGTVIITDPKLYANRKGEGYYKWKETCELYKPSNSEKCSSRLLCIFDNVQLDYKNNYDGKDVGSKTVDLFVKGKKHYLKKIKESNLSSNVKNAILEKTNILENIENNICFFINIENIDPYELAHNLCINSYAYYLADDCKKQLLIEMFIKLTDRIVSIEKQK